MWVSYSEFKTVLTSLGITDPPFPLWIAVIADPRLRKQYNLDTGEVKLLIEIDHEDLVV